MSNTVTTELRAKGAAPSQLPSTSDSIEELILVPEADISVRSFKFHASDEDLAELKRRINSTRFPEKETVTDDTQGVQLATIQKVAEYWANEHDWRKAEAYLNRYPQFITNIDGLDIHFIHVRSKHADALPVIITHGWPGSPIEQLKLIEPLTDPTAHGGESSEAFDVVIPSIPGFGFSGKPEVAGWGPERIAAAWPKLMRRLGYEQYVAQGGDWGALIVDLMGAQMPEGLLGIHTNFAASMPAELDAAAFRGDPAPSDLGQDEKRSFERVAFFYKFGLGYALEMGNRPQTLYGIADSPVGLAAWILDHDIWSYKLIARVFDGAAEGMTRDEVLDNITLFWLTNTAVSAARLYWENKQPFFQAKGVKAPTVISSFPDEICPAPRSWAQAAYPNMIYYKRHPKGAHFAAWEQPLAVVEDMRAGFASLRS